MRRLIGLTVVTAAFGAAPLPAQPPGEARGWGPGGGRDQAIVEYLDLSTEQQQEWKALHEQHWEKMKALFEEGRALRQKVRAALEGNEPDAVVGAAAKAAHAHRQRMRSEREAFETQLKSLLDADQQQKFEAFKAARRGRGQGWPGRGHRRGRPGRGPASATEG